MQSKRGNATLKCITMLNCHAQLRFNNVKLGSQLISYRESRKLAPFGGTCILNTSTDPSIL